MGSPSDSPRSPLTGARARRDWYALEERHAALFVARAIIVATAAIAAAALPGVASTGQRLAAIAACAAALVVHLALRTVGERAPRTLRVAVDLGVLTDGALVLALALLSGGAAGPGLWLGVPLVAAATLGLSALTGAKAVGLLGVVAGAVWLWERGGAEPWQATAPVAMAGAVMAVAAGLSLVNERELRRRGERIDALHDAGLAFMAADDVGQLHGAACTAAERLLPQWRFSIDPESPSTEGPTTVREENRVVLSLPIEARNREGAGPERDHYGRIIGSRQASRTTPVRVRRQQLVAIQTLATSLASALGHLDLVRRLEHLSRVDALTGLANRRAFDEALEVELARSRRTGQPLALVMLDVDHFKRFNDTFGHQAGDRALALVGDTLRGVARREDRPCRMGGEEFAVLLPGAEGAGAVEVAERMRRAIGAAPLAEGPITVSLGVAWTHGRESGEQVVAQADARLYAAKLDGRNRVVWRDPAPSSQTANTPPEAPSNRSPG